MISQIPLSVVFVPSLLSLFIFCKKPPYFLFFIFFSAETLVHSTLKHCDGADFTFPVFSDMKPTPVYVKKRPYLLMFLERVAEMFEIVIFTASQRTYAENVLSRLDPAGKLVSRCFSRESCIFTDGCCTKDLSILGVDLAKVAIIDNSPQVPSQSSSNYSFAFFLL